jgi:hypothetical protein
MIISRVHRNNSTNFEQHYPIISVLLHDEAVQKSSLASAAAQNPCGSALRTIMVTVPERAIRLPVARLSEPH